MQDSLYRFSLDIHSTQSQVSIPVPQFDTARGICATLTEAGKPYQISDGCHAVFSATKADGTMILNDCIIVNSSIIRYDFTEQTTAAVGIVDCSITIYGKNNKVLTSPRFTIVVYEGTRPNDVESKDEKNAIDNLFVTELNRIEAEEHRIAAETARSVAEQDRVNAELMRTAAELGRANSELTRSSAEQNRVNSESVRVEAERNRLNSESIRVEAEWKRVATELARDEAERKRAEAERQRSEVVLIDLVNAAIEEGKKTGVFGKSAYDFAKDGGYAGSEAEFAVDINPDNIKAGATPELGVDYFTEADKTEIAEEAAALVDTSGFVAKNQGAANVGKILVVGTDGKLTLTDMPEVGASGDVVGTLDGANNILLTGALASGTYTLKYEYEDGTVSDVGIIEVGAIPDPEPVATNFAEPNAANTSDWSIWINEARIGSDGKYRSNNGTFVTNYVAVQKGDVVYWDKLHIGTGNQCFYKSDKSTIIPNSFDSVDDLVTAGLITDLTKNDNRGNFTIANVGGNDEIAYIRLSGLTATSDLNNASITIKRNGVML